MFSSQNRYSLQHGLLASLPSNEAITTNFDELFEAAATTAGRGLAVLPQHPRGAGNRWLLKLHGTLAQPEQTVITRADYLQMPRRFGALMGLVQGMLLTRHMLFVGYSLRDEDFHELVHEVQLAREGLDAAGEYGTVLTLFDDPLEQELWADDLRVVPMLAESKDTTAADVMVAARQLEIFLDLVAFLSTTSAPFFLDDSYKHLTDDEALLRERLRNLAVLTRGARRGSVGYLVERFLRELGA